MSRELFVSCLRMPYLFEMNLTSCRWIHDESQRCFVVDRKKLILHANGPICTQCAVNLMSVASVNKSQNTEIAHIIGSHSIFMFSDFMHSIFVNTNYLYFFLQSKQHLHRFLLTATYIIRKSQNDGGTESTKRCDNYRLCITRFMEFVGWKKHLVRWFIESGNGRFFKDFVITEFGKYKKKRRSFNAPTERLSDRFHWMYPVITHLARHEMGYLHRAKRKKLETSGRIRKNYEWIEMVLEENEKALRQDTLDFMFCRNGVMENRLEFKESLRSRIVCDNRDCQRKASDDTGTTFKRCRRCRMMHYCSKRCQKIDWNKYNHRSLCFEYPLHGKARRQ